MDVWQGYNQGMQNLSNTLADMTTGIRQGRLDDLNARRLALQEQEQQAGVAEHGSEQFFEAVQYSAGRLALAHQR